MKQVLVFILLASSIANAQVVIPGASSVPPTPAPVSQTPTGPMTIGQSVPDPGGLWNHILLLRGGTPMNAPRNEHGIVFYCDVLPNANAQAYEKACFIPWITQTDPSDYSKGITKDASPIDARCYIDGNILTGRCWGSYFEAGVMAGSDGMLSVVEIGASNYGKEQPLPSQTNSKALFNLVAGEHPGNLNITGFGRLMGGSAKAYSGLIAESGAFVGDTEPAFGVQSNANGLYTNGLYPDGTVRGRHILTLINTPGLNAALLPIMKPGETFIWGDTSTGTSYIAFFDGQGFALWQISKYVKVN